MIASQIPSSTATWRGVRPWQSRSFVYSHPLAGRDHRPGRRDAGAPGERGRRPLRPPLRAAEVRQDEPPPAGASRRRAGGGDDPGARRSVPRRLGRRRDGAARARVRPPSQGSGPVAGRPVPAAHRHRAVARRDGDQRAHPARSEGAIRCRRCTRCSTCRSGSSRRRLPRADRVRRVPGHRKIPTSTA